MKKLHLFSSNSSSLSSISESSESFTAFPLCFHGSSASAICDPSFSAEAEQRIHDWLDKHNVFQISPDQHFRDYFQQRKDSASEEFKVIKSQSWDANPSGQSSTSSVLLEQESSQENSNSNSASNNILNLHKSPILTRRRINLGQPTCFEFLQKK